MTSFDIYLFDLIAEARRPVAGENFMAYHRETQAMVIRFLKENASMTYQEMFSLFGLQGNYGAYQRTINKIDEPTYREFSLILNKLWNTDLD